MNYIVLVKQVPDTKHIPQDAWDWEKGTLKRALLENVCNSLDLQALAFATDLRGQWGGRIVALTMGPPFADQVLFHALSLGADRGVLLTDRRLGGADTPATAYPIACAIRKIEREIFEGDRDYLIVCGMQSVDGDTAQVPPQIAEELHLPHVAYVNRCSIDDEGRLRLRRVTRGGVEELAVLNYPCLVTLTERAPPPFPTFGRTRWAYAQSLEHWDAEEIGADAARIGMAGSKTNVVRIFPARDAAKRRCLLASDVEELVGYLRESYGTRMVGAAPGSAAEEYRLPGGRSPEYQGDFWVLAEHDDGTLHPVSHELLGKARDLASLLGEEVGAVLVGTDLEEMALDLIAHGADKVFLISDQRLKHFMAIPYSRAIAQLVLAHKPQVLLFGATPLGRELAPRVAYATHSGLTADCTELALTDLKRGKQERIGILQQTRPALGGNIMASIVSQNSPVQMSTARPGVFPVPPADPARHGGMIRFKPDLNGNEAGVRICSVETAPAESNLGEAEIVVAGGRGCRTKENFDRHIGGLAEALEKCFHAPAMAAASRQAVEAGFIDRSRQIGQTGQTISPNLYLALGISGAVQHMTGVQGAGIVAAIDKDPAAPIFRACDFGLVADIETAVPELLRLLNHPEKGGGE